MILWMTRDRLGPDAPVEFWRGEPACHCGQYTTGNDYTMQLELAEYKFLTGLPLPRKGSKRKVEISISIKDAKGAKP